ncbi:glycosyltransferase family 4 protein [uncultured Pontibacter sp.]|uniref:glycosyltransferase family 4 protein n=1 Tax=uncultured Pontibacter sp. TaxID=453356 RepID=UPI0026379565|nr:glycosyltransferase family 4 protein [uncultured Pontibacter sp.]
MSKKVIFCTDGIFPYTIGGMQRHSRLLIEALAKTSSLELIVIHPHKEIVFDKTLGIREISINEIDVKKNYLLECYKYSKRIFSIVKEHPDAVIYSQGLSVWYKCSQLRDRLIVNPHGLEPYQGLTKKDYLMGAPFRLIFNYIFSNSRFIISLGGKLTDILKSNVNDKSKIVTIPNAVSAPDATLLKSKAEKPVPIQALFVSRFAHNKGIGVLMDAIAKLSNKGYEDSFRFKLAGKGPLYEYYTSNYKFNNVDYLGFVDDTELEHLYADSDVFVFPTLFEGMPTVVLEAMAKGLPIIVSDTGATAELVDKTNGYLIPKNDVDALTKALTNFSNLSYPQREALGVHSVVKVKANFTWVKVAKKHIQLFDSVM